MPHFEVGTPKYFQEQVKLMIFDIFENVNHPSKTYTGRGSAGYTQLKSMPLTHGRSHYTGIVLAIVHCTAAQPEPYSWPMYVSSALARRGQVEIVL